MKINKYVYLFVATVAFSFTSCSEDNDLEKVYEPTTFNVSGKVEKGPFVICQWLNYYHPTYG